MAVDDSGEVFIRKYTGLDDSVSSDEYTVFEGVVVVRCPLVEETGSHRDPGVVERPAGREV